MRHRRWRRICQSINSAFVSSCSEASPRRATRAKGHGDIGALAGGQIAQVRAESCDILKIIAHIPVHSTSQGECQKKKNKWKQEQCIERQTALASIFICLNWHVCVCVCGAGGEKIFITLKICIKYLSQMVGRLYGLEMWQKKKLS